MKVINGVYAGVTTSELDTLAAETAASMTTKHPDYAVLAARIAVSNLHKETKKCFSGKEREEGREDIWGNIVMHTLDLDLEWAKYFGTYT